MRRLLPLVLISAALAAGCATPDEFTARRQAIGLLSYGTPVADIEARLGPPDAVATFMLSPDWSWTFWFYRTRTGPAVASPELDESCFTPLCFDVGLRSSNWSAFHEAKRRAHHIGP